MALVMPCLFVPFVTSLGIQWNLRITDKLVHRLMSAIRRLSFIGGFLPKILYFTFYQLHILYFTFL